MFTAYINDAITQGYYCPRGISRSVMTVPLVIIKCFIAAHPFYFETRLLLTVALFISFLI